ncbi:MAG: TIGR01777 family protein [Flavobacteriaceae bacterium]|nr:TIGR01777 family protein [Flavobacteriaceae bacterium]
MHILITGASGLIGKSLIHALDKRDYRISTLSITKRSALVSTNIKTYHWSPSQGIFDGKALDGVDVIISLAGAKINQRWTKKNRKAILDSRLKGTQLIKNALKNNPNHNVTHFISASAIGLYPSDFDRIYKETETKVANSFTGEVVSAWEQKVDEISTLVQHVSKIRIGLVLAKSGGALVPLATPAPFGLGAWFGSGKQWQSWIHIQDLVQLFLFALDHPGTYNGVSPNPVTQKQLVKAISKQYKMPQWMPGIPAFVIKALMGAMANILLDSIRVSSAHAQAQGFSFDFPTLQEALQDLLPLNLKN